MRVVRSNNYVMAIDRNPAQYRPGNQLQLQRARASNPSHAESESFAPNPGEARSGNMVGDNGLTKHAGRVNRAVMAGARTLSAPKATQFTIPMPTISGAPPQQLSSPSTQVLTTPMGPADVRGMDGLGVMFGRGGAHGNLWTAPLQPAAPTGMVRTPVPTMRPTTGGSAEFHPAHSFRNMAMTRVPPAVGPAVRLQTSVWSRLTRPNNIVMRSPQDTRVPVANRPVPIAMYGMDGIGALDHSSLMLAAAALVGVYFLTKNRRTA